MPQTLKEEIENYKKERLNRVDKELLDEMIQITGELAESGIDKNALREGQHIPSFALKNVNDKTISTDDLLKQGPLIISFYAGGWCPYCNLELRYLQNVYPQFKSRGANLIALSPTPSHESKDTVKNFQLEFDVLHDVDNQVAKSFGLVYGLMKELANIYRLVYDLDLKEIFGEEKYELPISANYIVNQDGIIHFAFIDANQSIRMEPSDLIEELKNLDN